MHVMMTNAGPNAFLTNSVACHLNQIRRKGLATLLLVQVKNINENKSAINYLAAGFRWSRLSILDVKEVGVSRPETLCNLLCKINARYDGNNPAITALWQQWKHSTCHVVKPCNLVPEMQLTGSVRERKRKTFGKRLSLHPKILLFNLKFITFHPTN
ncbi:hypothetical protein PILCRDRAFT_91239 [Piloderma croceum F 1598]|uniref:Uncharacterized protein n=1 Tax=Piloderma croceum (strain F 1598) TaxID=765440 RepID=A0A0C3EXE5_PILCF|nr:hypothetical protein PILCRDRAFT_91239 [Piloderma croceum F 1598]